MATLVLKLTDAGLAAVQSASGTDPVTISHLGLTAAVFDYAPTLTALPGEFKRLDVASGVAAAPNITHLTAYDTSADEWTARGFGLFLSDGTLFAVHNGAEPVLSKVGLAFALLAFDIAFEADFAANIEYGNAVFAYPPATETYRGVARIATQARVDAAADAGDDAVTIVTPKTLRARLAAFTTWANEGLALLDAGLDTEAEARVAADDGLAAEIAAIIARLDGGEFSKAISATLADKGHVDVPIGAQVFRISWGKTLVAANTAAKDTYEVPFSICYGVFQGGGSTDTGNSSALRAYPGANAEAFTHVNLTNGFNGPMTIHWIAIGLAA